MEATNTRSFSY